jgi:hypothetical protein
MRAGGAYHNSLLKRGPLGLDRFPHVPEYTASLTASYDHPLTAAITGIARLGFRYRSGGILPTKRCANDTDVFLNLELTCRCPLPS